MAIVVMITPKSTAHQLHCKRCGAMLVKFLQLRCRWTRVQTLRVLTAYFVFHSNDAFKDMCSDTTNKTALRLRSQLSRSILVAELNQTFLEDEHASVSCLVDTIRRAERRMSSNLNYDLC